MREYENDQCCGNCSRCIRMQGLYYYSITKQVVLTEEGCCRFVNDFRTSRNKQDMETFNRFSPFLLKEIEKWRNRIAIQEQNVSYSKHSSSKLQNSSMRHIRFHRGICKIRAYFLTVSSFSFAKTSSKSVPFRNRFCFWYYETVSLQIVSVSNSISGSLQETLVPHQTVRFLFLHFWDQRQSQA